MKNIVLYIGSVKESSLKLTKREMKKLGYNWKFYILRQPKEPLSKGEISRTLKEKGITIVEVNFDNADHLFQVLYPFRKNIFAISARSERNIGLMQKVIPHVPYLKTPTVESLVWSTQKNKMRKRFRRTRASISPKFTEIEKLDRKTLAYLKDVIGFPLVIKPSGLAGSLLVSVVHHKEELENAYRKIKRKINSLYSKKKGRGMPTILAEQFMEGEQYSVDAYVNSKGKVYFCPMVHQKISNRMGIDDFFPYHASTPTSLKSKSIEAAQEVASQGIHALGLRSCSAHVELIKTDDGWKIIEIGPRIGGGREAIYEMSYGIAHGLNDILIRAGRKPIIPKKVLGYTRIIYFFARQEGILSKRKGVRAAKNLKSFKDIDIKHKVGDRVKFAKNGGEYVFKVTLFNRDKAALIGDVRRLEKMVEIETE